MELNKLFDDDRAVSPVIGVILMVAITVILAAVIGTFVLGLGDQIGENAPQASFSTDVDDFDSGDGNGLEFTIEKTGGQDISADELRVTVDGSDTGESVEEALDDSETWRTGQEAVWDEGEPGDFSGDEFDTDDRITIRIIHNPSGDSVYSTTVTVPEDSA